MNYSVDIANNKYYGDYHTHSNYSDSQSSIRANVEAAIAIGLKEIAITDHGFNIMSHLLSLTPKKLIKQQREIELLRNEFPNIKILSGIEANLISIDGILDLKLNEFSQFDIVNVGYHSFSFPKTFNDFSKLYFNSYKGNLLKNYMPSKDVLARNTKAYISSIKKYPISVIAHLNNFCKVNVVEFCKACYDYGTMIELNSKHIDIGLDDFDKILSTKVQIIANTDSHKASRVGDFSKIEDFLKLSNVPLSVLANYDKKPVFKHI